MMCYRDKTFCTAPCANIKCCDKFTEHVQAEAIRWWGSANAPIAMEDLSTGCKYYKAVLDKHDTDLTALK